jgi:CRP-like cAMP-binding protein
MRAVPTATIGKTAENRILSLLCDEDKQLLASVLEPVDLPVRRVLESRNRRIEYVYFIDHGIASVVADGKNHSGIEIGIIGREGSTGLAVLMGADRAAHHAYMQVAGAGRRVKVASLLELLEQSKSLHQALLRQAYAFTLQTAQTAVANGRHKLEERLARWLLMAHDRIDGDELPLTHEFLSVMLAVRRPGVTVAINSLQNDGLIKAQRGGVLVIDRAGLEERSNGAYSSLNESRR